MSENSPQTQLHLDVSSLVNEAEHIVTLELREKTGLPLPAFEPGSHLELHLPNGLVRHYSLYNDCTERHRYCIGVGLAHNGHGGSRYIHDVVRCGDTLAVSPPKNNFHLVPNATDYCFIAGGIGITPILSMIRWCIRNGKPWRLYYCARSRPRAAFHDEIRRLGSGNVLFHFDDEHPGRLFDPTEALRGLSPTTHVYCCGPAPLMVAVLNMTSAGTDDRVHFEWFSPRPLDGPKNTPFTVLIHSSGKHLPVPEDRSILSVLEDHGILIPSSCREGLCATCETAVIAGIPDHRDSVLSPERRAANRTMMVCVSRAKSQILELDL